MSVLGLKFVDKFKQFLVEENHDFGHHYIFRFPNNYDDVKGYLTDDNVIELLEKIKQY